MSIKWQTSFNTTLKLNVPVLAKETFTNRYVIGGFRNLANDIPDQIVLESFESGKLIALSSIKKYAYIEAE